MLCACIVMCSKSVWYICVSALLGTFFYIVLIISVLIRSLKGLESVGFQDIRETFRLILLIRCRFFRIAGPSYVSIEKFLKDAIRSRFPS